MVLPIGTSVRPYEIVMLAILGFWVLWVVVEPHRFPTGLLGLVGAAVFAVLVVAPFLNGPGLNIYQTNGAERGVFRLFLLAGLFLSAYHFGYHIKQAKRLLAWVIAVTVFQAVLGVYEFLTRSPLTFMFDIARSVGLVFDPNGIRAERVGSFFRESGQLRAAATAPHPIVFSAVIAMAVLAVAVWLIYANSRRTRRWLIASAAMLVVALPVANSRTAFVMLLAAGLPLVILLVHRLPKLIVWSLALFLAMGVAFAISPQTPRLLLDSVTRSSEDPNTQIRLERFSRVPELLQERPILGAGYLSHDPEIQIFDNAYNLGLIEFGLLGFFLTMWWFLIVLVRCWTATRSATYEEAVLPILGVLTVVGLLAASATFDAWTFDQYFPTVLIVLGVAAGRSDVILRRERLLRFQVST